LLANIGEVEHTSILERQKEGLAIEKAKGIHNGRAKKTCETTEFFFAKHKNVISYLGTKN